MYLLVLMLLLSLTYDTCRVSQDCPVYLELKDRRDQQRLLRLFLAFPVISWYYLSMWNFLLR